jgi:hypothetical protein
MPNGLNAPSNSWLRLQMLFGCAKIFDIMRVRRAWLLLSGALLTGCGAAVSVVRVSPDIPRVTPTVKEPRTDTSSAESESRASTAVEFQFETALVGNERCSDFAEIFMGADNREFQQFLEPGLAILAADLGVAPTPNVQFTLRSLDVGGIQSVLKARSERGSLGKVDTGTISAGPDHPGDAIDPAFLVRHFGTELAAEEARLRAARTMEQHIRDIALQTVWDKEVKDIWIDSNGLPPLRVDINYPASSLAIPGDSPIPRLLVGTDASQHVRFDLSLRYVLTFDAPRFRHTVYVRIRAYTGLTKTSPSNLQPAEISPAAVAQWKSAEEARVVQAYQQLLSSSESLAEKLFGAASRQAFLTRVKQNAAAIKKIGGACRYYDPKLRRRDIEYGQKVE